MTLQSSIFDRKTFPVHLNPTSPNSCPHAPGLRVQGWFGHHRPKTTQVYLGETETPKLRGENRPGRLVTHHAFSLRWIPGIALFREASDLALWE
jgi:hypothetical protein